MYVFKINDIIAVTELSDLKPRSLQMCNLLETGVQKPETWVQKPKSEPETEVQKPEAEVKRLKRLKFIKKT